MAMPDRPGIFKAKVYDFGLTTSKEGTPQFEVKFFLTHFLQNGDWHDWSEYGQETTGWFYPFKKDGSLNETTIDQLMESFGWDGCSLNSLENGQYAGMTVQVTIKEDTYNGTTRLKVAWVNPENHQPGIKRLDAAQLGSLSSRFDQMLRARNAGKAKASMPQRAPTPPVKAPARAATAVAEPPNRVSPPQVEGEEFSF